MANLKKFLKHILDSVTDHIVVIDSAGEIQYVNKSWSNFGSDNSCNPSSNWIGVNYLAECDKASKMGDSFGLQAAKGIRSLINRETTLFYFEYPCHSPTEERWFMMRVTPFQLEMNSYFVVSHQNITERKLAEEKVSNLARIDGLTGIPNRRAFDEFLHNEWRRCGRLKKKLCLAIIDLDYFKLLNDTSGHQAGDLCLVKIGGILKEFSNRPGDLCARYGGDEFVLVLGDTSIQQAEQLLNKLLKRIAALHIANKSSPVDDYLTLSIGVAEATPYTANKENQLLCEADQALYQAKSKGRNRVESKHS